MHCHPEVHCAAQGRRGFSFPSSIFLRHHWTNGTTRTHALFR